ncbi:toprim domain-containing protein [Actinomadura fibrosa]|uniref:Toprim domain-containing protein n=1 Tax=Actinomadura fibrosa TaxID=111802 RepID=A0ABW2XIE3_9ACTN|nr:toprim domain-containing protein [Actinomadura fibrosa]
MPATVRDEERHRLASVLRGIAAAEEARLRDGTRPWAWWLGRAALHGRHGYTGTLLIGAQWRAATDVRSYEEWRAAGRQVRRGEAAIRLLTPSGGVRAVFDVAQTTGLPLPPREPADPGPAMARLAALASRLGVAADGADLPALVRRLAHALLPGDRDTRRVEADSAAFLVLAWLGLEPQPPSFPATAPWAGPAVGDRILRLARRLHACASEPSGGVTRAAHRFFRARLRDGWVPAYLAGRGFPAGVQRRWQIGYAPPGPRTLTDHLRGLGHGDDEIVAAGLARRGRSGPSDTFQDRAMFALRTPDGTVAGFIGRRADGGPGPKYLNGPDTALFHKGELLYGLHEARDRLAAGARPVLVEGPLDAIAVTLAAPGDYAAVATCGLSFTAAQLGALASVADLDGTGVLVALDGDPAGRRGALRAWEHLAAVGGPVETAALPSGLDPAGVLRAEGRAALRRVLRAHTPLMDEAVDAALTSACASFGPHPAVRREASAEERLAAVRAAAAVITARPGEAARQAARVASRTGVPAELVTDTLIEAAARVRPACGRGSSPCAAGHRTQAGDRSPMTGTVQRTYAPVHGRLQPPC